MRNMRAKILHAEGKTDEALEIYKNKYTNWYHTCGQKCEQLYEKGSVEHYEWTKRNMEELISFAAQKFARIVFYDKSLSMKGKFDKGAQYLAWMKEMYEATHESFFDQMATAFAVRLKNDFRCHSENALAEEIENLLIAK